eukprot:m.335332 g.335332  ORF g.335332 m.335332 type:complete len:426 (+) comp17571_c0_seq1:2-1279(+)
MTQIDKMASISIVTITTALLALTALSAASEKPNEDLAPIVHIPGITASQLWYNGTHDYLPNCKLTKPGEDVKIWPASTNQPPDQALCTIERMTITYNPTNKQFTYLDGVHPIDFGGLSGYDYGPYMRKTYSALGWVPEKNLFGITYDWRFSSIQMEAPGGLYQQIKELIEHAYTTNNNRKVILQSCSFGPTVAYTFLQKQTQAWKDKYISLFVAIAPLWSGSTYQMKELMALSKQSAFERQLLRLLGSGLVSTYWILPRAGESKYLWSNELPLLETPTQVYYASNTTQLLVDAGFTPEQVALYERLEKLPELKTFAPPGVNTYVNYGTDVPTVKTFHIKETLDGTPDFLPTLEKEETESGDGAVAVRSSIRVEEWEDAMKKAGKTLTVKGYKGLPHACCMFEHPQGHCKDPGPCFNDMLAAMKAA